MCNECSRGALPQAVLDSVSQDIQADGWCLAGTPDYEDSGITYSIGFHERDKPELASPGLCPCHDLIVLTLAERQRRAGAFEDGQITQVEGVTLRLTLLDDVRRLPLLSRFYRHRSTPPTVLVAEAL